MDGDIKYSNADPGWGPPELVIQSSCISAQHSIADSGCANEECVGVDRAERIDAIAKFKRGSRTWDTTCTVDKLNQRHNTPENITETYQDAAYKLTSSYFLNETEGDVTVTSHIKKETKEEQKEKLLAKKLQLEVDQLTREHGDR